ncbi:MAG: DUF1173 family protein [Hyphomicrobiales bacterium]|nr:DUF1173 family protein [Hyphomicrobiales bacterium]
MTVYLIDNHAVDSEAPDFQRCLADAHQRRVRPLCTCRHEGDKLAMVLAQVKIKGEDRTIIRRLPGSGHDHAADCRHHEEPEGISGLTQVRGTAIQHDEADDTYKLKLDFPLGRQERRLSEVNPNADHAPNAPRPKVSRLRPLGLLHHLWEGADLTRMNGGILNHRSWNVVRTRLLAFVARQRTSTRDIAKQAFIPQSFTLEDKPRLEGVLRKHFFNAMTRKEAVILIGEVKDVQDRQLIIKHLPFLKLLTGESARSSFAKAWGKAEPLRMAHEHSHIVAIAIVFIEPTGVALVHDIDMMNVTAQWVPFEGMDEHALLASFDHAKRSYQKSLSYGTPAPISVARLLDTGDQGTACFMVREVITPELQAVMVALAANDVPLWCWAGNEAQPALPKRRRFVENANQPSL